MSVATVYRYIIDDVIKNVKAEFSNEGFPEQSIQELQQLWETKLLHSGAILPEAEGYDRLYDSSAHPQYSYIADYSSNYGMPAPSVPGLSSIPQRAPYSAPAGHKGYTPTPTQLPSFSNLTQPDYDASSLGRPQQYMPPASWTTQRESQDINLKLANKPGRSNNTLSQHDGASDIPTQTIDEMIHQRIKDNQHLALPQYDGSGDKKGKKAATKKKVKQEEETPSAAADVPAAPLDDEELDSDLDDPDDEEPETDHIVLCQFEKVTRIKNKRKCNLKDGVMHINGRDYLFNKANGEFDW